MADTESTIQPKHVPVVIEFPRPNFETVATENRDHMFRFALFLLHDYDAAEDATQDALARACQFWPQYRPGRTGHGAIA